MTLIKTLRIVNKLDNIPKRNMIKATSTNEKALRKALDRKKRLYIESNMLLEKIEINNDLNIDNHYYVYKYFELQKQYVKIEKIINELNENI